MLQVRLLSNFYQVRRNTNCLHLDWTSIIPQTKYVGFSHKERVPEAT